MTFSTKRQSCLGLGLVDFAIGLVILFLTYLWCNRQVKFFWGIQITEL